MGDQYQKISGPELKPLLERARREAWGQLGLLRELLPVYWHGCPSHRVFYVDEGWISVEDLARCRSLSILAILNFGIGVDGARAIAQLSNLCSLTLTHNSIGVDGARAIAQLSRLSSLDLGSNRIGDEGARAIAQLSRLSRLSLSGNRIGDEEARAIAQLSSLSYLDLSYNSIGDEGARAIARLSSLSYLDLSGNNIGDEGARAILGVLAHRTTQPKHLHLQDNNITVLPRELLATGDGPAILAAYRRYAQSTLQPLNEAKLLVLGDEAVGKTSLIRYLITGKPRDRDEGNTPGIRLAEKIETHQWATRAEREGRARRLWRTFTKRGDKSSPRLNVWDFGGQEIMRGTHKFFLTERSIYLLVLEERRQDDTSVDPWLATIADLGCDSPVLIVINKSDEGRRNLELDETALRREWPTIVGILRTSCIEGAHARKSISTLRATLLELLHTHPQLEHVRDEFPTAWRRVKDALAALARERKVLGSCAGPPRASRRSPTNTSSGCSCSCCTTSAWSSPTPPPRRPGRSRCSIPTG